MTIDMRAEITRHYPALYRFARTLTRNTDQSDDLVQDTIERALTNEAKYRPDTSIKAGARAWLFTVMRNLHVTNKRRDQRVAGYDEHDLRQLLPQPIEADAGQRALEMQRAFMKLTPRRRRMLMLSVACELGNDQIAPMLGVNRGTVKSAMSRGRNQMAKELGIEREPAARMVSSTRSASQSRVMKERWAKIRETGT